MKLEIYGKKPSFSAHGEYEEGVDPEMSPCPFCGSTDLICENTHTPYYWVHCEACEADGPKGEPDDCYQPKTEAATRAQHIEAFNAAVDGWNLRPESEAK